MFVLIVGCGRAGAALAKNLMADGHTVSVLDESADAHRLLDIGLDGNWEDAGGMFTVGTALETDALIEAGIERADAFVAATNGDNTNLVIAQIAQRRFNVDKVVVRVLDPNRATWYGEQGLKTICPTQAGIDMLIAAVKGGADSGAVGV